MTGNVGSEEADAAKAVEHLAIVTRLIRIDAEIYLMRSSPISLV
ncbi:hypothetical protein [Mesorhizobium sp. M0437]